MSRAPLQKAATPTPSTAPLAASLSVQVVPRPRPDAAEETAEAAAPVRLGFLGRPEPPPTLPPVHPIPRARGRRSAEAMPEKIDLPLVSVRQAAMAGIRAPSTPLPFAERIQRSFGGFDLHGVRAHLGGEAPASARSLGARAYTIADHVVFAGRPDLFTAAHEAAHVVQQRAGARPAGGIDRPGDSHERNADAVAEQVVAGRPAERLLAPFAERPDGIRPAPHPPLSGAPVQRKVGLEIESLIPVHEAEDQGPGKPVIANRRIATYESLRLAIDHAGGDFATFPGGSGIVEYQTPARPDNELKAVLADVEMASALTIGILEALSKGFAEGKRDSAVMKPSAIGDNADDKLELGLKGATQKQIAAIDGSGRFQINIGVPASAVRQVFGVGASALLRGEELSSEGKATPAGNVYNLLAKTALMAAQLTLKLGITAQKYGTDAERTVGFLTLLLQHLVAPTLVPRGKGVTEKQHFAFLPKTPLHLVLKTLHPEVQQILSKNGEEQIMKLLATEVKEVKADTVLASKNKPTVGQTLKQVLAGADDPVVTNVFEGKPLGLEAAGGSKEAPVLETRHIRGPRVPPKEWVATATNLLTPLLKAIANKT